jgi:PST family polysaccharide transporter
MTLWVVPHIIWCVRGTLITFMDVVKTASRPVISSIVAALPSLFLVTSLSGSMVPGARLALGLCLFATIYLGMLLFVMGQKDLYLDLLRGLRSKSARTEASVADV